MGMTHGEPETYPRTGDVIGFCAPEQAVDVAEAVVTVQRDYGDRSNRKHARLKYTIDDMGLERFVALVNERLPVQLEPPGRSHSPRPATGWAGRRKRTGRRISPLFVENGRIRGRMMAGLHAIAELGVGRFIMTPNQNLILADIPPGSRDAVEALLAEHGLDRPVSGLAAQCDGLRGAADLWAGAGRERTLFARSGWPAGRRTGSVRSARRRNHHPHDRLPERLRPAVCVGDRLGRTDAGYLQPVSWRRA